MQVPPRAVQAVLRRAFAQWGLPERLRVDNGHPWGSRNDLPRELALWLLGLGVGLHWNRPRHPQENGKVERAQGTTARWAEPQRCATPAELQAHLTRACALQREQYPTPKGPSRSALAPELGTPRRPYEPAQEAALWAEERVWRYLEQGVWQRLVDQAGKIYLYNRAYQAGQPRAGETVSVRCDGRQREWVLLGADGGEIRRFRAEQLCRDRMIRLDVAHHKPSRPRRPGGRPDVGDQGGNPRVG
jgi:hypothetical protein